MEKKVTLLRKKSTPFTVNYPSDGRLKKYVWGGTVGKLLDKRDVPFDVYDWLARHTTTFSDGELIIADSKDEEVKEIKESIENVEDVEKVSLTKADIEEILTKGNHLSLKKALNGLIEGQSEEFAQSQKKYVISVATEIGVDASSKRKVLCEWAGLNVDNADLIFDKDEE